MILIWFIVGLLIAGLMLYSQWSDIKAVQLSAPPSLQKRLRRRGVLRTALVSLMLFAVFYFDYTQGFVALAGFWLCRTLLLYYLNRQQPVS